MPKQSIHAPNAPAAVGPYSHAVRVGDLLYTSGQIPLDPASGALIEGDIQAQTWQVFRNLEAVLAAAGADFSHVVKATVFLRDMNDFAAVNEIYAKFFEQPYPARSAVQVARLPKDAGVEIELTAYLGK